jgi:ATP/ADP translocase
MEDESQQTYTNLIYMGGFLFFIGLTSLITRLVPNLDLRPKVQVHGVFAAMLVSAGVSIITMLLFLALSVVG